MSRSPAAAKLAKSGKKSAKSPKAKAVLDRPETLGWLTSDENEIGMRRWRGRTEIVSVAALEGAQPIYGTFRAGSTSGGDYEVEIRSLDAFANSCNCIDYRVNGLGTCKHIEGTLAALARVKGFRAAKTAGNRRVEVFLDRRNGAAPAVNWPVNPDCDLEPVRDWLSPYLAADWTLTRAPQAIESLIAAFDAAPAAVRTAMRVSRHFAPWLDRARRERARVEARAAFEADLAAGRATLDILKHKLLPYQCEGVLHLAFGERALLADEMGLGKTIQAIAACVLLGELRGVKRVLIVCPTSLKAEWEEQIAKFCDRQTRLVFGSREQRCAAYREPAFFTIVNYEQVLGDADSLNGVLRPDIVVLDEAQRIKNWQTKTARMVKSLRARYAFVLTGTPVENRIDELYSIIQYLDPETLGPLFRFNRDFYKLDERGRPMDYQNLAALRERLAPLLLRRRKADVEGQLPGRTVKNFFVPMAEEQRLRYEDYHNRAAKLIAQGRKRPLTQKEFEILQMLLACMRMICDTPAILDPTCRISPKLEELEGVLGDLLAEPDRKVIVFSEWERMLTMVRELAGEMGIDAAWHTGSVPQIRRRAEIKRFKNDPACRLFLSTDSGSVGLNLQVASAVVNVDLPWNPAKLEQRIARAWRKNQTRSVTVINMVTEDSIEHSMLHVLGAKQALADGVLDGAGDLAKLTMPSGRGAFIERMKAMMETPARPALRVVPPEEAMAADLIARHGERVLLIEARIGADGTSKLVAVLDLDPAQIEATSHPAVAVGAAFGAGSADASAAARSGERAPLAMAVEIIDSATWRIMRRLANTGLLHFVHEPRLLYRAATFVEDETAAIQASSGGIAAATDAAAEERRRVAALCGELTQEADRALRKARLLASGGFPEDAPPLLLKALQKATAACLVGRGAFRPASWTAEPPGHGLPVGATASGIPAASDADIRRLAADGGLPAVLEILDATQPSAPPADPARIGAMIETAERFVTISGAGLMGAKAAIADGIGEIAREGNETKEAKRAA